MQCGSHGYAKTLKQSQNAAHTRADIGKRAHLKNATCALVRPHKLAARDRPHVQIFVKGSGSQQLPIGRECYGVYRLSMLSQMMQALSRLSIPQSAARNSLVSISISGVAMHHEQSRLVGYSLMERRRLGPTSIT